MTCNKHTWGKATLWLQVDPEGSDQEERWLSLRGGNTGYVSAKFCIRCLGLFLEDNSLLFRELPDPYEPPEPIPPASLLEPEPEKSQVPLFIMWCLGIAIIASIVISAIWLENR